MVCGYSVNRSIDCVSRFTMSDNVEVKKEPSIKVLKMSKEEEAKAKREHIKMQVEVEQTRKEIDDICDIHCVFKKFQSLHDAILQAELEDLGTAPSKNRRAKAQRALELYKDKVDYAVKFQMLQIHDTHAKAAFQQARWEAQDRGELPKPDPKSKKEAKENHESKVDSTGFPIQKLANPEDPDFKPLTAEEALLLPELSSLPPK